MKKILKFTIIGIATVVVSILKDTRLQAITSPNININYLLSQTTSAASSASTNNNSTEGTFLQNIIVAVVSATLTYIFTLLVEKNKKKNEPNFQISYSQVKKKGIVEIEKDIESKIKVLYNGAQTKNLYYFLFDMENTGNSIIKEQEVRFEFVNSTNNNNDIEIADTFYEPQKPEPEMGVEQIPKTNLDNCELKYKIGYLDKSKKLGFRFIVASSSSNEVFMKHYHKNEKMGVEFIEYSARKIKTEVDIIRDFIILCLFFISLPIIVENLVYELGTSLAGLIRLILLTLILNKVELFVKTIIDITNYNKQKGISINVDSSRVDCLVVQDGSSDNIVHYENKQ